MKTFIVSSLVVGGLALSNFASAQVTKEGAGYRFKAKYAKGQVLKYDMTIKSSGKDVPANAGTMSMPFSLTVKDFKNGIATIRYQGEMMGQKVDQTIKMDQYGKVVGGQAMSSINATFPNRALKVGESWKMDIPMNSPMAAGMKLNGTYKFVGLKSVGGKQVAHIGVNLAGAGGPGGMKITGKGAIYVLVADGHMSSATVDQNMVMSSGQKPMTLKMNVSIKRK
ncbi:MAG: hypothetical protein HONBIEJF_00089 [Fimbriimonadaceae bacterium]|nr:hypothetical protein [Fimbriimonadaceae bacterium]